MSVAGVETVGRPGLASGSSTGPDCERTGSVETVKEKNSAIKKSLNRHPMANSGSPNILPLALGFNNDSTVRPGEGTSQVGGQARIRAGAITEKIQSTKSITAPSLRSRKPANCPKLGAVTLLNTALKLPWFVRLSE